MEQFSVVCKRAQNIFPQLQPYNFTPPPSHQALSFSFSSFNYFYCLMVTDWGGRKELDVDCSLQKTEKVRKTKTIKNQLLLYFQLCFKSFAVILSELLFNFCNSDTKNITRYSARRTHFEATEVFATHPHTMSIANRKISDLLVFSFAISVLALQRNTIKSVIILY